MAQSRKSAQAPREGAKPDPAGFCMTRNAKPPRPPVHAAGPFLSPDFCHQYGGVLESMGRMDVATGTVKWFNPTKGYGFIQPDTGGKDVFVHISAVEKAGFTGLAEGAKVSYEVVANRGKESAENLRIG